MGFHGIFNNKKAMSKEKKEYKIKKSDMVKLIQLVKEIEAEKITEIKTEENKDGNTKY